ncbi:MAG: hypothetical protein WBA97_38315, partial [Actinophytocola sp.]|uniref:hypothetical protein n=1 Tax=Actinophytocola sp. TaxID=1872138 RepID=UPI003C7492C4
MTGPWCAGVTAGSWVESWGEGCRNCGACEGSRDRRAARARSASWAALSRLLTLSGVGARRGCAGGG